LAGNTQELPNATRSGSETRLLYRFRQVTLCVLLGHFGAARIADFNITNEKTPWLGMADGAVAAASIWE
jgi:hypothetical protein